MDIYLVGGAVRDALLGLPVHDCDYVVVGATPEAMLAQGFLPVGRDFPVFLHPRTRQEYALARTERKTAKGYHGFEFQTAPEVTLQDDLSRRDLTINSIAVKCRQSWTNGGFNGKLEPQDLIVDPYNGQADLRARVLRHVTAAFAEDPVRILRIARFSARFHDFSTAPETQQLMTNMVAAGEADALVPERVWQELSRGLMEAKPSRMLQTLQDCHALPRLLPQLGDQSDLAGWLGSLQVGRLLDGAAGLGLSLATRFAVWMSGLPIARLVPVAEHLRVPGDCRSLAELVQHERDAYMQAERLDAVSLVGLLERCDAWRRPARFADALAAWQCLSDSAVNAAAPAQQPNQRLLAAAAACLRIDAAGIAQRARVFAGSNLSGGAVGLAISHAIHAARVEAVTAL